MKYYQPFGGGVNSTALKILLDKIKGFNYESVFVDLGCEYPETYNHINNMIEIGFDIKIIKPSVEGYDNIYDYYFDKKIVPFFKYRSCTDKFKIMTQRKYYKSKGEPYTCLIGYDKGELNRVPKKKRWKNVFYLYPLIAWNLSRNDCKRIIKRESLNIPIKSGCFFCIYQSKEGWSILKRDYPNLFERACLLEENSNSYLFPPNRKIRSLRDIGVAPITLFNIDLSCRKCVFGIR